MEKSSIFFFFREVMENRYFKPKVMEFCHEFSHVSGCKGRPSLFFKEILLMVKVYFHLYRPYY